MNSKNNVNIAASYLNFGNSLKIWSTLSPCLHASEDSSFGPNWVIRKISECFVDTLEQTILNLSFLRAFAKTNKFICATFDASMIRLLCKQKYGTNVDSIIEDINKRSMELILDSGRRMAIAKHSTKKPSKPKPYHSQIEISMNTLAHKIASKRKAGVRNPNLPTGIGDIQKLIVNKKGQRYTETGYCQHCCNEVKVLYSYRIDKNNELLLCTNCKELAKPTKHISILPGSYGTKE